MPKLNIFVAREARWHIGMSFVSESGGLSLKLAMRVNLFRVKSMVNPSPVKRSIVTCVVNDLCNQPQTKPKLGSLIKGAIRQAS